MKNNSFNKINFVGSSDKPNIKAINIDKGNELYITLSSQAQARFKGLRNHTNALPFFREHGHKTVLDKSSEIMNYFRSNFKYCDELGVCHGYEKTLLFHLRLYLHYLLLNTYIIDKVINSYSPNCVSIPNNTSINYVNSPKEFGDNLFSLLVKQYIKSNNLDIEIIVNKRNNFVYGAKNAKKALAVYLSKLFFYFFSIKYKLLSKHKKIVIVSDDTYKIYSIVKMLKSKDDFIFPVYLNINKNKLKFHIKNALCGRELFLINNMKSNKVSLNLKAELDRFAVSINNYKKSSLFNFIGIDLRPMLTSYISKSITGEMADLEISVRNMHKIIGLNKPVMALSQHALGYSYALGEICSMKNIPGLLITHGTHVLQKEDKYAQIEWYEHAKTIINARFSHSAIQSPMADEFFSSLGDKYSTGLKTGPLIYSRLKYEEPLSELKERLIGRENINKKIIINAGTPKGSYGIRPWVFETTDEYIRNINDLIDAVDCLQDVYLIVRFRPSYGLNKDDFSNLIKPSNNFGIYSEGEFEDYLAVSDLLVSYSSTTIEEALQKDVAVLQYDHDDKYIHIQAPTISEGQEPDINPIYYCGNKEELKNSIDIILKNIDLIKSQKHKWDCYRYPIDKKLEWFDKLLSK